MIAVTGGAGFIGSAIVWALNRRGIDDIIIAEEKGKLSPGKKKNLENLSFRNFMYSDEFLSGYASRQLRAECIFHMGACSSTTETDRDYIMNTNYNYTLSLASEAIEHGSRFIYASSAATYGNGNRGFSDSLAVIKELEPMNLYGESKHRFDIEALETGMLEKIAGLKYFNVYGPNEYHKGDMRSFVPKAYTQVKSEGKLRLFRSYRDDIADGEQKRDFLYIKDAVEITLHIFDNPSLCGIFNAGTGRAESWNSLASAVFKAMDLPPQIEYIDMPEVLKEHYQYHTCADTGKLAESGFEGSHYSLEEGVCEYIKKYLSCNARLIVDN